MPVAEPASTIAEAASEVTATYSAPANACRAAAHMAATAHPATEASAAVTPASASAPARLRIRRQDGAGQRGSGQDRHCLA